MLTDRKITGYVDNVKSLSDTPSKDGVNAEALKAILDGRTDKEVKTVVNGISDDLMATTNGTSGADNIGIGTDTGLTGTTVKAQIKELKDGKVEKIEGKGLSTNDYDNTEKQNVAANILARHNHDNKGVLDSITDIWVTAWNSVVSKFSGITGVIDSITAARSDKIPTEKAVVDFAITAGAGDMLKAVFDPQGKKQDIFAYADSKISVVNDDLSKIANRITYQVDNLDYNVYQLFLQNYYDSKYPLKKGFFFDGFTDSAVIDTANSTAKVDTINRKVFSPLPSVSFSQTVYDSLLILGHVSHSYPSKIGQLFTIPSTAVANVTNLKVNVILSKQGTPLDGIICRLYYAYSGSISSLIATSPDYVSALSISSGTSCNFNFTGLNLVPGNTYIFAVERLGGLETTNYYYVQQSASDAYAQGNEVNYTEGSAGWQNVMGRDLKFTISFTQNPNVNTKYQSKEQVFTQDISNCVLYVKSKTISGCSISAEMAIYSSTAVFSSMTLESTRDLGGGYKEDKFVFSTPTAGTKAKVRLTLNRPNTSTAYEVNRIGCILGVS